MPDMVLDKVYHTTPLEQTPPRDKEYLRWRDLVAVELLNAGMEKEHDLWIDCSDPALFFTPNFTGSLPPGVVGVNACSTDPHHQATAIHPTCSLRFCPDCCHRQSARLLHRYMPFLKGVVADSDEDAAMRHIVLTTPIDLRSPDCRSQVVDLCSKVVLVFDELLGADWRSDYGLLFAYEFGENGHKLHFHCLAYCPYIDQADITDAWREITGGLCEVTFIRLVTDDPERGQSLEGAVAEVLKYATKLWKRDKNGKAVYLDPALVPLLGVVLKGSRRIRSYGIFYRIPVESEAHVCEICSSSIIRFAPLDWELYCQTGWMPSEFALQLQSIPGNNFLDPGGGKTPKLVYEKLYLPMFDPLIDNKKHNQFDLGG